MKKHKPLLIILCSICLFCMFVINFYIFYIILLFEFQAKPPDEQSPPPNKKFAGDSDSLLHTELHTHELHQKDYDSPLNPSLHGMPPQPKTGGQKNDSLEIQTGQLPYSDIYVREVPIQLEPETKNHLAQFRSKARLLYQEFPDSFRISINISDNIPKMEGSEKIIALTFDDGPDDSSTLEVVNILNKYGIPGTFFLIGHQMDRYPETIKAILDGRHVIGNHSWSHIRPTDVSTDVVMDEVTKAQQQIANYGVITKLYRPPYGLVNRSQMPALIEAEYQVISWSIDSMDWYFDNPDQIVACVVENAHPGAIVLMHSSGGQDNRRATVEALPIIIKTLLDEGYQFVGLGK